MSAPNYAALGPLPSPPLPLHTRIIYYIRLALMHYGARLFLYFTRLTGRGPRAPPPTLLKSYPAHPHLTHRIFYPPSYLPGYSKPPLYIDIHGGGFALLTPAYDDAFSASLAASKSCIVISLDYSKSPFSPFPTAYRELVSTVSSILADISLSYDRSRVCIGGFSAGGNLALAVAAAPSLRRKIHGVAAYYPVTDFSTRVKEKARTRPYRDAEEVDGLLGMGPVFNAGYIPEGQDLRDPVLSPAYGPGREALPEWVCIVGAEEDMLAKEAGVLAGKLAGVDLERQWGEQTTMQGEGRRVMSGEGPEKAGFEVQGGRTKWVFVRGAKHGFTHWMGESGAVEERRIGYAKSTAVLVEEWLSRGPWDGAMPEEIAREAHRRSNQR